METAMGRAQMRGRTEYGGFKSQFKPPPKPPRDSSIQLPKTDLASQRKQSLPVPSPQALLFKQQMVKHTFVCGGCGSQLFSNRDFATHTQEKIQSEEHPSNLRCNCFYIGYKEWMANTQEAGVVECYRRGCKKRIGVKL